MKKATIIIIASLFSNQLFAQLGCDDNFVINFDSSNLYYEQIISPPDTLYLSNPHWLSIDTVNYHRNQWQIGRPAKPLWNEAHSYPNVIVTDTLHPVTPNDSSVFIIKFPKHYFEGYCGFSFYYKLDIDTGDLAFIEYSTSADPTWTNILADSGNLFTVTDTPHLTSSTSDWDSIVLYASGSSYIGDSIFFRFTFITDSDSAYREGWMIDDITIGGFWEGKVNPLNKAKIVSIFPNPATTSLTVSSTDQPITNIAVTNLLGQTVYTQNYNTNEVQVDVSALPSGVYFVKVNGSEVQKFVKE